MPEFLGMPSRMAKRVMLDGINPPVSNPAIDLPLYEDGNDEEHAWFLHIFRTENLDTLGKRIPTTELTHISQTWNVFSDSYHVHFAVHPEAGIVSCLKLPCWSGVNSSPYVSEWRNRLSQKYFICNTLES